MKDGISCFQSLSDAVNLDAGTVGIGAGSRPDSSIARSVSAREMENVQPSRRPGPLPRVSGNSRSGAPSHHPTSFFSSSLPNETASQTVPSPGSASPAFSRSGSRGAPLRRIFRHPCQKIAGRRARKSASSAAVRPIPRWRKEGPNSGSYRLKSFMRMTPPPRRAFSPVSRWVMVSRMAA
jgi:hypothetical protein